MEKGINVSCIAVADINELKVFVDLASISAGENDLDVDRVACFHDAVLGYSSMLYGLPQNADFNAFKEALAKLWKALGSDSNIPNKLVRCSDSYDVFNIFIFNIWGKACRTRKTKATI